MFNGSSEEPTPQIVTDNSQVIENFIALDKKKAEYKQFIEEYKAATEAVVAVVGVGGHFQDADGTVYLAAECNGKFVYFDQYEIQRTRREGEPKGTLSMKAAKELGYTVDENRKL